jgi:hypothetical protein
MSGDKAPSFWLFSNKPEGAYGGNVWDMGTILKREQYSLKQTEPNRKHVKPGDTVYMRIYGQSFIGKFVIGAEWKALPASKQKWPRVVARTFQMKDVKLWSRPVPQNLIIGDLSTKNHRRRVVRLMPHDARMIETAQRVYTRLGFGGADGQRALLALAASAGETGRNNAGTVLYGN